MVLAILISFAVGAVWMTVVAFGATLLWRGLRGRLVDRHVRCRRCGYDLAGSFRRPARCSECGEDLLGANAVTIGNRKLRPRLVVVGTSLLLVASSPASWYVVRRLMTPVAAPVVAAPAPVPRLGVYGPRWPNAPEPVDPSPSRPLVRREIGLPVAAPEAKPPRREPMPTPTPMPRFEPRLEPRLETGLDWLLAVEAIDPSTATAAPAPSHELTYRWTPIEPYEPRADGPQYPIGPMLPSLGVSLPGSLRSGPFSPALDGLRPAGPTPWSATGPFGPWSSSMPPRASGQPLVPFSPLRFRVESAPLPLVGASPAKRGAGPR